MSSLETILERFVGGSDDRSVICTALDPPGATISIAADAVRPAASVLKLSLALAVVAGQARGTIDLTESVPVADLPTTRYPHILAAFDTDRRLSLAELVRLMLLTSDNGAASYLFERIGPQAVVQVLDRMGCSQTRLACGFSDHEFGVAGYANQTTAQDCIRMLDHVHAHHQHDLIGAGLRNNLRNQRIPLLVDDDVPVLHKTGTLAGVVADIGLIYTSRQVFALAFLTEKQSSVAHTSREIGECVYKLLGEVAPAARIKAQ